MLFSDGLEVNKKNWGRPFRPPQHGPRSGSAAANGIAPSVIKDKPMIKFVGPAFLSSAVNLFLKNKVPSAMAIGGTIPPIITAAIIL